MAASVSAVFGPTRGLMVLSLLCLLCLANTMAETEEMGTLEKFREALKSIEHRAEFVKRDCGLEQKTISNSMEAQERKMNTLLLTLRKAQLEVKPLLEQFEVLKSYVKWADESIAAKAQGVEEKLSEMNGLLKLFAEEDHDEF